MSHYVVATDLGFSLKYRSSKHYKVQQCSEQDSPANAPKERWGELYK